MKANKRNQGRSILGGILISAVILCPLYLAFFFLTFNLGGGETISEIESQNTAFLVLSLVLAIVIAVVMRRLLTNREQHKAYGVGILSLIIFIGAIAYYVGNFIPHKSFDNALWIKPRRKSLGMAATLVEEQKLVGLNRQEVEKMLGKGDGQYGSPTTERGSISYFIEDHWTMTVYFEKDKVVSSELRLPWLGV
jgi:hypothetical protein